MRRRPRAGNDSSRALGGFIGRNAVGGERIHQLPHISLGTVYRNLEVLSDAGVIQRVEMAGAPRHYDLTVKPHYHIRCLRCGKVEDVAITSLADLERQAQAATGYQVVAHQVELVGFCPQCKQSHRRAAGGAS